jgi:uncharacterized membrane protein YgcG
MAAEYTGITAKLAAESKLEADMVTWLRTKGYEDYDDIAMACSSADGTDAKFIKPMVTAEVKSAKDDGIGVVRLRKFWLACSERHAKDRLPKKELEVDEEAPIPEADALSIAEMWFKRHNYVLPDAHLLIDNQQGRMWRDFTAKCKAVDVWLINKLRPRSCRPLPTNTAMAVVAGKAVKGVEVIADDVARSFDLLIRARTFFMTAAFVSITDTTWFPLQSAVSASEVIMNLITATWDNRSPPVSFHITAWGTTAHHFSEQVRITKRTLKEVVENIGAWEHYWKWSPSSSSAPSGGGGGAPDNQSLLNQLNSMKGQMLQYKQQADDANQRAITASRDRRERSEEFDFSENKRSKSGNGGSVGGGRGGKGGKGRGGKGAKKNAGNFRGGRAPKANKGW